MTKSVLKSRTFWLAALTALVGVAMAVVDALTDAGVTVGPGVLVVLGALQGVLRADTRGAVYLRAPQASAEGGGQDMVPIDVLDMAPAVAAQVARGAAEDPALAEVTFERALSAQRYVAQVTEPSGVRFALVDFTDGHHRVVQVDGADIY